MMEDYLRLMKIKQTEQHKNEIKKKNENQLKIKVNQRVI